MMHTETNKKIYMKNPLLLLWALAVVPVIFSNCKKDRPVPVVVVAAKPMVDFTYELVAATDLKTFHFKSTSSSYKDLLWQFGDDSIAVAADIKHTYQFYGKYKVILTARNVDGYWAQKVIQLTLKNPAFDSTVVGENYTQTNPGILTVTNENGGGVNGGEGSAKLVDGHNDTKYLFDYPNSGDVWMKYQFPSPITAGAYTLVSGNDAPSRDLKSWRLEASNNNLDWVILDTQTGVQWTTIDGSTNRNIPLLFFFNNAIAFSYYRLFVTQNNGSNLIQVSEWTINKNQP